MSGLTGSMNLGFAMHMCRGSFGGLAGQTVPPDTPGGVRAWAGLGLKGGNLPPTEALIYGT